VVPREERVAHSGVGLRRSRGMQGPGIGKQKLAGVTNWPFTGLMIGLFRRNVPRIWDIMVVMG